MVNKNLFKTNRVHIADAKDRNAAGGTAYSFTDEHALAQYVVTGTFNGVFYVNENDQLDNIKKLVDRVSSEVIAKCAVYGFEVGRMKDIPAYLIAVLAARKENDLLAKVFPRVIVNAKMLSNFVQIMRSGVTGRRSFGTFVKKLIQNWFTSRASNKVFNSSIGLSNPSLEDIIKISHPKPKTKEQEALYGYLLGKKYDFDSLPGNVRDFEIFKKDNSKELPDVPFRALTNCKLTVEHWKEIALNMPWNTLRMNLNMLHRNGVFEDSKFTNTIASKIRDADEVRRSKVFPYQLLTAYQNTKDIPSILSNALQDALEIATENVPSLETEVAVCMDLSGSMHSPVTGYSNTHTTVTTCVDVATLMAACLARTNPECKMIAWASSCGEVKINPKDSIVTNSRLLGSINVGGGTNAELGLGLLNKQNWKGNAVVYISDNESWMGRQSLRTGMAQEWQKFKNRNKKAKLVCIDIQPTPNTQVPDNKDVLNIGGFSDSVFDLVHQFVTGSDKHFADIINEVRL